MATNLGKQCVHNGEIGARLSVVSGRTTVADGGGRTVALTPRERDCLRLVWERRTTKEIARDLNLRPGTVFRYIKDAQTKLGAPNRRAAADLLFGVQRPPETPIEVGDGSDWVEPTPPIPPVPASSLTPSWRDRLPIRKPGAPHNDLNISLRLAWVLALAVALAVGFGMLAVGAQVVSDLLGAWYK